MPNCPNVHKFLDASTGCLTKHTRWLLENTEATADNDFRALIIP